MIQIQIQEKRNVFGRQGVILTQTLHPTMLYKKKPRVGKDNISKNQCPDIQFARASTPFGSLPFIKPMLIAVLPVIGRPDGMSSYPEKGCFKKRFSWASQSIGSSVGSERELV
jgi:hypothetical protein